MAQLISNAFPLLLDGDLSVIRSYGLEMMQGMNMANPMGDMCYVIIDRQGTVRKISNDPSFGHHGPEIIAELKSL